MIFKISSVDIIKSHLIPGGGKKRIRCIDKKLNTYFVQGREMKYFVHLTVT